jgi:hypothetical protein
MDQEDGKVKPIRFSQHARGRMLLRGATETEVIETIRTGNWESAQRGKFQAHKTIAFGLASPVSQQIYAFKTIHVVFADEQDEIVVVTVLVYYGNEGG